jgi:hypothetical protein
MLTRRSGLVKRVGQNLIVMLNWIESRKHRQAAKKLHCKLNQLSIKMVGPPKLRLLFRVVRFL